MPLPSYPAAIATHPITPYEAIPEQPPMHVHPLPTMSTSTATTTRRHTRTRPATPIVEQRNCQPQMMTVSNAPHYHPGPVPVFPLAQHAAAIRCQHQNHQDEDDNFVYNSDFKHNQNT